MRLKKKKKKGLKYHFLIAIEFRFLGGISFIVTWIEKSYIMDTVQSKTLSGECNVDKRATVKITIQTTKMTKDDDWWVMSLAVGQEGTSKLSNAEDEIP